jgi:tetratricopeptide (TPR) repeat protein
MNYYTALLVKAQAFENLKDYNKAIEIIDTYLESHAGAADILEWKGDLLVTLGDTESALSVFREAARFNPESTDLLNKIEQLITTGKNGD